MTWQVGPVHRGTFVGEFAKTHGLTLGIELGTFDGESAHMMLDAAPDLHLITIDLFENQPRDVWDDPMQDEWEMPRIEAKAHRRLAPYGGRCLILTGDTHKIHRMFGMGFVDFLFIDANHAEWALTKDLQAWYPKLRQGGYVFGHDWSLPGVQAAVKEFVRHDDGVWCGNLVTTYPDDVWGFQWCP